MPKVILGVEVYTLQEAAEMLGVTIRTVQNYIRAGRIKGQIIGKRRVFTREELERFLRGET